jgi:ribonuclease P protein component
VYRQGRSLANRHLVLYCFANPASEHPRLGLSVSRKVGGAVERNHVKRLLREAFAQVQDELVAHHDIVVVARPGSHDLAERGGLSAVSGSLNELIDRGRLRQTGAQAGSETDGGGALEQPGELGEAGAQMHALAPAHPETASAGRQAGEPRLTIEETARP